MDIASLSDPSPADFAPGENGSGPARTSRSADFDDADFAVVLLLALTTMAARSSRRQADLTAALRGAGVVADPVRIRAALRLLRAQGAIEHLVPLSDGGLLLSVTHKGTTGVAPATEWLSPEDLDASLS